MVKEIQNIDNELSEINLSGVARYGDEAGLPHAKGIVGKALENEVIRRNDKYKRQYGYIDKVNYIADHIYKITNNKERVVLDCLLDGLTINAISRHMGVSRTQVNKLISDILEQLVD